MLILPWYMCKNAWWISINFHRMFEYLRWQGVLIMYCMIAVAICYFWVLQAPLDKICTHTGFLKLSQGILLPLVKKYAGNPSLRATYETSYGQLYSLSTDRHRLIGAWATQASSNLVRSFSFFCYGNTAEICFHNFLYCNCAKSV